MQKPFDYSMSELRLRQNIFLCPLKNQLAVFDLCYTTNVTCKILAIKTVFFFRLTRVSTEPIHRLEHT
jgi:hypothetical protein